MTTVRAGLSAVMVGRAPQARRLDALAHGLTQTNEPSVAWISGEAGVGKSRLVREFLAAHKDLPAFVGHAEPEPLGRPFHVVQSALQPAVSRWTSIPAPLEPRAQALRVLLGPVSPVLGSDGNVESVGASRAVSEENLAAAVDLVRVLLDGRPGILVAEDLHWADAESLLLVGRLATTSDLPLLVIGTFRPGVAETRRLADMLDRVGRQRMVENVELAPLTQGEVAEWLGSVYHAPVSRRVATDLARRTSGNPFFLEELVSSAPDTSADELCLLPLPASISEAVLRHLDGLDATQRRIADTAAVLGRRVPFDLLAAVTGAGEDDLVETMRCLVDRGLVVEIEPDVFGFRHALTREAIIHRLLGRQRRRVHEKAHAALLEMGSDDWGALAYHASGANLWDDVIDAARRGAGVHLRTGSTYEALRLAELGLQEAEADIELLYLATRAAWACGLGETALRYASQWAALAEAGTDDAELSRALRAVSRLRWESGDRAGREEVVERLLHVARRMPDGPDLAEIYGHVAEVRMLTGQSKEAIEWADRAIALCGDSTDGALASALPAALVNKGSALLDIAGHFDEGSALLTHAIDVAVEHGDALSALRGVNNLLQAVLVRWPREKVWALVERAHALMTKFGWYDWNLAEVTVAYQIEAVGDAFAGRAVLDRALADPVEDEAGKREWLSANRAWVAIEIGEPNAVRFLEEARAAFAAARISFNGSAAAWLESLDIELAGRTGDVATADAALRRIEELTDSPVDVCNFYAWAWGSGLLAALRAGVEPSRVEAVFDAVVAGAGHVVRDEDPGWRAHVAGAVAARRGDHASAVEHFRTALAMPWRRPGVTAQADVHVGLARSLIALGDLDQARECVETAGTLLQRWAGWRVDEIAALRHRLASGSARVAAGELTARERDVAALVARGLSNGEIGRALFISTKTASSHVSNILAKLRMTSRAQIAAWASSEELDAKGG